MESRHRRTDRARWLRLPAGLTGARWEPSLRSIAGVVIVALLAAGVFGVRVAQARAVGEEQSSSATLDTVTRRSDPVGLSGVEPGVAAEEVGAPAAGSTASELVVHVVGQVAKPGVVALPPGSRVSDAIEKVGGATAAADLALVNLARLVVDGEQIRVPAPGELPLPVPSSGGAGSAPAPVSLSGADAAALDALPGIGPVLAARIVEWRERHGRFTSVDELAEVDGIGSTLVERLRPLVVP